MTPNELKRWKKLIGGRLDMLKSTIGWAMARLAESRQQDIPNDPDIRSAWNRVVELFPEDFAPSRQNDLSRHIAFGCECDFRDILDWDIPDVERAVQGYGRGRDNVIGDELAALDLDMEMWELLHPQIRDACMPSFDQPAYGDAARKAVEVIMSEIRKRSGRQADGDALIRGTVGIDKAVGFSSNGNDNERQVTEGLKQMLQGAYKGIRNPASHGYAGYSRLEAMQIMVLCSFIIGRMRQPSA